jgi:hypothetical protein
MLNYEQQQNLIDSNVFCSVITPAIDWDSAAATMHLISDGACFNEKQQGPCRRGLSQSQINPHPRPHPNLTPTALDTPHKDPAHTISTILDPTSRCCTDVHAEK